MSSESPTKRQRRSHLGITTTDVNMEALFDQKLSQMEQRMQSKIDSMQGEMDAIKDRLSRVDEMEKRCKYLEDKCASMTRSLKVLAGRWEYSTPGIPASHRIDSGFDEDSSDEDSASELEDPLDQFIGEIEDAISELKKGRLMYAGGGRLDNELFHDDVLLPHWQILADAVDIYGPFVEEAHYFSVCDIQLSSEAIKILTPSLNAIKRFTGICLHCNEFEHPRDGIDFAAGLLQSNSNVEEFEWVHNSIATEDEADSLLDGIASCPSIRRIRINDCCGSNTEVGYHLLTSLLSRTNAFEDLERDIWIDLGGNFIRTEGQTHLSDYLTANPRLGKLDLARNRLDDSDARAIADALSKKTNLWSLDLEGNDITEIGQNALREALFDKASLNSAADSNHTCKIDGIRGCEGINYRAHSSIRIDRRKKIYVILANRNRVETNVHHLNTELGDDSLKLVPKVLECVHKCAPNTNSLSWNFDLSKKVPPLAIFFELLRNWKMPSLYESGRCG